MAVNTGWQTTFALIWDKTTVSRDEIHASIIDAGKFSGLGDGRSIGFGRFSVENFDIKEKS